MKNILKIKDIKFEVCKAEIIVDNDGLTLNVETISKNIEGEDWQPSLVGERLQVSLPLKNGNIDGEIRIPLAYDNLSDKQNITMYVFEHGDTYDNVLSFKNEDGQVILNWTGKCDVNWDDKYGDNLEFIVKVPVVIIKN
jgi:hypothetical protein